MVLVEWERRAGAAVRAFRPRAARARPRADGGSHPLPGARTKARGSPGPRGAERRPLAGRADRGVRAIGSTRRCSGRAGHARAPGGAYPWSLGARRGGAFSWAARRRRRGGGVIRDARAPSRGDRALRGRAHPPVPRRTPETRGETHRRVRRPATSDRRLRAARSHAVGDAGTGRTARDRGDPEAPARRCRPRRADGPRAAGRAHRRQAAPATERPQPRCSSHRRRSSFTSPTSTASWASAHAPNSPRTRHAAAGSTRPWPSRRTRDFPGATHARRCHAGRMVDVRLQIASG